MPNVKSLIIMLLLLFFFNGCDLKEKIPKGYEKYINKTIEFLYPAEIRLDERGNILVDGYDIDNNRIFTIYYEMIIYPSPDHPAMELFKNNEKDSTYNAIRIGNKEVLVKVEQEDKNKLLFHYKIKFRIYSWSLVYFLETDKKPEYYINSDKYPELAENIIKSAVIKSAY